jgi:gamma-glutamyl-gamma-aminobutyrate hydrolase PuuD
MKKALAIYRDLEETAPYQQALRDAGIEPQLVLAGTPATLGDADGLVLLGGSDLNPALYGEPRGPETDEPDDERDRSEYALIAEALERDVPVLAICRGLQILNVQQGGTLVQDIPGGRHVHRTPDRSLPAHAVVVTPGTLLAKVACDRPTLEVNSRHHQAIGKLGQGLVVSARDPEDGVIEGIELPDNRFVLAVQWHPEDQSRAYAEQARLFSAFADAL